MSAEVFESPPNPSSDVTPWFHEKHKPVRVGVYAITCIANRAKRGDFYGWGYAKWDGRQWSQLLTEHGHPWALYENRRGRRYWRGTASLVLEAADQNATKDQRAG